MHQLTKRPSPAFMVVALAINLVACGSTAGGPSVEPSRSAAAPSPFARTAEPSTSAAVFPPAGVLKMGERHAITLERVPFTFAVPTTDWVSNGSFGIDKAAGIGPAGAGFIFWRNTPDRIFREPCLQETAPSIGTLIADLAAGVASVPGIEVVEEPTDVTVGGFPAKRVVTKIPDDIGCPAQDFHLWTAPGNAFGRYATVVGSTIRTWIIDVEGTTVWFDAETYEGAGPGPGQEIQAIVDSMEFE